MPLSTSEYLSCFCGWVCGDAHPQGLWGSCLWGSQISVGVHTHELPKVKTLMTSEGMLMVSERLPHQVRTHQLSMLILGNRAPSGMGRRDMEHDGGGEVDRVREVLWQHHRLIYGSFDYYASLYSEGQTAEGEPDIYNMSFNAFLRFMDQCQLVSKDVSKGEFQTVWFAVNAVDKATADEDEFNSKSSLNRQEWLQVLVRCAILLHSKRDVSESVNELLTHNLLRLLPPAALQNSNAFRKRFCYLEAPTLVLESHQQSLFALYDAYAQVSHGMQDRLKDDSLMSIGEWLTFVRHVGLVESGQLTELAAKQIFLWSRIRTAKDLSGVSEAKLRHITPTDFLEALVRLSLVVALPTDLELEEAKAADAGEFLLAMQTHSPTEFQSFLSTHRPRHQDHDGSDYAAHALQPAERCLEHLIKLIVRTVQTNTSHNASKDIAFDWTVEDSDAAKFLKRRQQNISLARFESNDALSKLNFSETLTSAAAKKMQTAAAIMIQLLLRARKARKEVRERRLRADVPSSPN